MLHADRYLQGLPHHRGGDPGAQRHLARRSTPASSSPSWARPAAASRRCSTSSACSTARRAASYGFFGEEVAAPLRGAADPAAARQHRLRLPELQPDRRPDRRRERRGRPALSQRRRRRAQAARRPRRWSGSASPTAPSTCRSSSPAASSSAWPWPAPWCRDPKLILADEPTGNLDTANGDAVMELLDRARRQRASPWSWSPTRLAHAAVAQRTIKLLDGRVVSETLLAA